MICEEVLCKTYVGKYIYYTSKHSQGTKLCLWSSLLCSFSKRQGAALLASSTIFPHAPNSSWSLKTLGMRVRPLLNRGSRVASGLLNLFGCRPGPPGAVGSCCQSSLRLKVQGHRCDSVTQVFFSRDATLL